MRSIVGLGGLSLLLARVAAEAEDVGEKTWQKSVQDRIDNGQFVFVKFLAPWCGHCKKLKPDWDKLGDKFNYKTNAHIVDVDCTADSGKKLCETYGVSGYPTIKYFKKGGDPKGSSYDGAREFSELKKFVTKQSKKPCDPATLENCDKKDKKYIEEIKDWDAAKIKEEYERMDGEVQAKRKERDDLDALFEKQKDEAIATQKKADAAKKEAGKLEDKFSHKVAVLGAKLKGSGDKKEEL